MLFEIGLQIRNLFSVPGVCGNRYMRKENCISEVVYDGLYCRRIEKINCGTSAYK